MRLQRAYLVRFCHWAGNYFNGRERYRTEFDDALDNYLKQLLHDQTALFELVKFHYTDWTNRSALYEYQRGDVSAGCCHDMLSVCRRRHRLWRKCIVTKWLKPRLLKIRQCLNFLIVQLDDKIWRESPQMGCQTRGGGFRFRHAVYRKWRVTVIIVTNRNRNHIRAFDWNERRWPWMTFNVKFAVSLLSCISKWLQYFLTLLWLRSVSDTDTL